MPKNTKKVRATKTDEMFNTATFTKAWRPIWSLPRTAEAYDAMVEQIAREANRRKSGKAFGDFFMHIDRKDAVRALRAIGITRPKKVRP